MAPQGRKVTITNKAGEKLAARSGYAGYGKAVGLSAVRALFYLLQRYFRRLAHQPGACGAGFCRAAL